MNPFIENLIVWFLWECAGDKTVEVGYYHESEEEHGLIMEIN